MIETNMSKKTILIVDDIPTNLDVLFKQLELSNFRVLVAQDGASAIRQAEFARPDIILLDVMMPDLDGFETCRRLKANEITSEIPVIFMTALSDIDSKVKGFEVGGVDYVTKPIRWQEVFARVTTHTKLRTLQKDLQEKNVELQEALDNIKVLKGLLPICTSCKKIRDDQGYWQQVEIYIHDHSEADFTHGFCPGCIQELYPEHYELLRQRKQNIIDALSKVTRADLTTISTMIETPEKSTSTRLEAMLKEKIIKKVEVDGKAHYELV